MARPTTSVPDGKAGTGSASPARAARDERLKPHLEVLQKGHQVLLLCDRIQAVARGAGLQEFVATSFI